MTVSDEAAGPTPIATSTSQSEARSNGALSAQHKSTAQSVKTLGTERRDAPFKETRTAKKAKITHEAFAAQIESRLGTGGGENARGPDMKVWSKGRGLNDVSHLVIFIVDVWVILC